MVFEDYYSRIIKPKIGNVTGFRYYYLQPRMHEYPPMVDCSPNGLGGFLCMALNSK